MVGGTVQNSQSLYLFIFNTLVIIHEYIYPHSTTKFTSKKYINSHLTTCFLFTNIFTHIHEMNIHFQRLIFIHIHERNIGSTRCNISSAFSAHRLRALFGPSSRSIISERNMADEGRTIICRGRTKTQDPEHKFYKG